MEPRPLVALIALSLLLSATGGASGQDALRGKRLYYDAGRMTGAGLSCVDCHGAFPGAVHGIGRAAGDAALIEYAIGAIPPMAPLRGRLTARDLLDLAAYLQNPGVSSPDLRVTTCGPASAAHSGERLEFMGGGATTSFGEIQFANVGSIGLRLTGAPALSGAGAPLFEIVRSDCQEGVELAPASACSIRINFRGGGGAGSSLASVSIEHDWIRGRAAVALIGRPAPASRSPTRKPIIPRSCG